MDWAQNENKYTVFDKHKSWYKVDIDGDFITKTSKTDYTPKKKLYKNRTVEKTKKANREICFQNACVLNDIKMIKSIELKPDSLNKTHELIFKLGIHLCFSIIMLLTAYCGFSYVLPTQIILSNLSALEIEGVF